ncbi:MAG: 23S rRNA pseudouridylate synthase [Gammaproteobacteria bacterium]|nr:23S rRNA pseudouridylate synthase [Gammaproteobacteria bacterium]|tara:strand:+ start:1728 stop:2612 length:885 start_codon:yes stop_codon:yes gene_type:complete
MTVKKLRINKENAGRRLDNYLISYLKNLPKTKIYKIIRKGEIRINSSRVKPDYRLKDQDLLRLPPNLVYSKDSLPKISEKLINDFASDLLFENDNFLVLNKKSNISVHGGTKNNIGLIHIIRYKYGNQIDLCHRLDKYTTGCLVFGKNKKAVKHFNTLISNKEIRKIYSAILLGKFNGEKEIKNMINKSQKSKRRLSISRFKKIKSLKDSTLVEVEISTGRTHQIRIHASQMNHPILLDNKYGNFDYNKTLRVKNFKNIALHSKSISFKDIDNKLIDVSCNNPEEFVSLIRFLQ